MKEICAYFVAADESRREFGAISSANLLSVFDQLPWNSERARADELRAISPTLWLAETHSPSYMAITVLLPEVSDADPLSFLVMFERMEAVYRRRWFKQRLVEARVNYDLQDANIKDAQEMGLLFVNNERDDLVARFHPSRRRVLEVKPV